MEPVRRIVTGHDENGKSIFLSIGEAPQLHHRTEGLVQFHELWSTSETPAPIYPTESEPNERLPLRIPPDKGGTIVRILDIHPGHLRQIAPREDGRHPGMHRTETIDYGIMIEGEITMLLDDSEVTLRPGDVVIQRGTDHGWENRSETVTARIAFVLIDGYFAGPLAEQLKDANLMHTTIPQKAAE
ncbi:cupin domain-containing protein [Flavisphingomonas formosensis]|uniref:cupin domain-containing protein n=1 Tax=Flavisphingomonas formosensis TaxID=861534 RepID=UPI00065C814F|nr:cupin domain-containing protein [Sphingomonas formosensis]